MGNILWELAVRQGIVPVDIDGAIAGNACSINEDDYLHVFANHGNSNRPPELESDQEMLRRFFLPQGLMYGPLRSGTGAEVIPDLDRFNSIIMLRDPRDALTSLYFSIAYSRSKPKNNLKKERIERERKRFLEGTIDEAVLARAGEWAVRYQRYLDSLIGKPGVTLLKYEDMVTDFPGWFDQLVAGWGLDLPEETRTEFLERADFSVKKEDVMSHKRQVTPGDHRRKLKSETIGQLNDLFGSQLGALEYEI